MTTDGLQMTDQELLRDWARRCADITRGRLAECMAWEKIAERGQEFQLAYNANGKPYRGGPMMTRRRCFTNAARTVLGHTAFDPEGCKYAEGWALSRLGFWNHHAWTVNACGLAIERTWKEPGSRYVGVTFHPDELENPGFCQLSHWPLDTAWAPDLLAQDAAVITQFFAGRNVF